MSNSNFEVPGGCSLVSGAKKDWFGIDDAYEHVQLGRCFIELAHLTSTPELGLFKRCKFTLEADGKYRAEYEY